MQIKTLTDVVTQSRGSKIRVLPYIVQFKNKIFSSKLFTSKLEIRMKEAVGSGGD